MISPNYPGEEFETLDRQILVVCADVLPQDGETDTQRQECENANTARAVRRQQEIAVAASCAGLQPSNAGQVNANAGQVNANAGRSIPIPDKPTPTPGNKHLWTSFPTAATPR
jgi:type II secretory pathway pseudopilin PulG